MGVLRVPVDAEHSEQEHSVQGGRCEALVQGMGKGSLAFISWGSPFGFNSFQVIPCCIYMVHND